MGEQLTAQVETATIPDGSWKLAVTWEDGKTIAEVWSFGVKLSVTTLTDEGVVTVMEPVNPVRSA